jgi:hypothetical protein
MLAEDKIRLKSGTIDREAWAGLWDRLPERARRGAVEFVLEQLHAWESSGQWSIAWHYKTNEERGESGAPTFEFDQPGDIITFEGSLRVGNAGETTVDPEQLVSVACLTIFDWLELRQADPAPSDLGDDFKEYDRRQDERFAELARSGKNPCRVPVPAAEFLAWCSSRNRVPDRNSRDSFATERFELELAVYKKRREEM